MKVRCGLKASVAALSLFVTAGAHAGDYGNSGGYASCLYARIDGGGAIYETPSVSRDLSAVFIGFGGGGGTSAVDEEIENTGFIEGGLGCQVTETFRVEAVGGVRLRSSIRDPYNTLDADLQSYVGFVNVFYDITNYGGWTPYIGAGVGVAYHEITNVSQPVDSASGDNVDIAINLQAGFSYDITPSFKLDAAYRLTDLGEARSGGAVPLVVDDIIVHEFKVGLRYHFGSW